MKNDASNKILNRSVKHTVGVNNEGNRLGGGMLLIRVLVKGGVLSPIQLIIIELIFL